jgi:hypothetical protein
MLPDELLRHEGVNRLGEFDAVLGILIQERHASIEQAPGLPDIGSTGAASPISGLALAVFIFTCSADVSVDHRLLVSIQQVGGEAIKGKLAGIERLAGAFRDDDLHGQDVILGSPFADHSDFRIKVEDLSDRGLCARAGPGAELLHCFPFLRSNRINEPLRPSDRDLLNVGLKALFESSSLEGEVDIIGRVLRFFPLEKRVFPSAVLEFMGEGMPEISLCVHASWMWCRVWCISTRTT